MSDLKLHPDVEKFKIFAEKNPQIIRKARTGKHDLNYYFKHYQKYGEEDSFWDQFDINRDDNEEDNKKKKKGWTDHLKDLFNKIEFDQVDDHLKQADSAITELKKLLDNFSELRGNRNQSQMPSQQSQMPPQPLQPPPQLPPQQRLPMGGMNRRFF